MIKRERKFPFISEEDFSCRGVAIPLLILIALLNISCVPEQGGKKQEGACGAGKALDAKTRTCYSIKVIPTPPTNSLKILDMVEDTPKIVELSYTDKDDDFAVACEVSDLSLGLTLGSTCTCVGGFCSVSISPDSNFFGIGEFRYWVEDKDGRSTPTLVRVNVAGVDDTPLATNVTVLGITGSNFTFQEEETRIIGLNYTDVENDKATACEVNLADTMTTITTSCNCSASGVCQFSLTGKTDRPDSTDAGFPNGTGSFTFRVYANGAWSNRATATFTLTNISDLPQVDSATGILAPNPIYEDDSSFSVVVTYYDGDGVAANNCSLGSTINLAIGPSNCLCPTSSYSTTTKKGSCDLNFAALSLTAPNENKNSSTPFRFQYNFQDATTLAWGANSSTISLTVEPVNDVPTASTSVISGIDFPGVEDTALTIDPGLTIDEGGACDEDAQSILVKVESLTTSIVPNANVLIKYGTTSVGIGGQWHDLRNYGDGTTACNGGSSSSDQKNISFVMTPLLDQTGTASFTLSYKDSLGSTNSDISFTATFAPGNDDPSIWLLEKKCPYNSYLEAQGCGTSGCFSNRPPTGGGLNLVPNKVGQVFYDYASTLCYHSTGTSTSSDWQVLATACPFSKSSVETGCASGGRLNCLGSATPVGSVTPTASGRYFYDYTNNKCFKSTGTTNTSWTEENVYQVTTQCNNNQSGIGTPLGTVIPTSTSSIYKDTASGACYVAATNSTSSWTAFSTNCPITTKSVETNCKYTNCIGGIPPRGDNPASDYIIPSRVNSYYYDYNEKICYRSVGTSSDPSEVIKNWVIDGVDFTNVTGNEGGPIILKNIIFDEGGDSSEDAQTMTLHITNLTNEDSNYYPGNENLLVLNGLENFGSANKKIGIYAYKNGTELTGVTAGDTISFNLSDTGDAQKDQFQIHFIPSTGKFGRNEMRLVLSDSSGNTSTKFFSLQVYPVGANHKGWKNIQSLGQKVDKYGNKLENLSVKLEWDAFDVEGSVDTNTPMVDPARTDYTPVSISGYNVYRRMAGENFNFSLPLNSSLIDKDLRSFTDTYGTTNAIPGPPSTASVYYYTVVPVDSLNNSLVHASQPISTIRVVAPPDNMGFVHRWLVNKEICEKMNLTPDENNNYRCLYSGPGEYNDGSNTYYDIQNDLLVDRFEAGCPYSETGDTSHCNGTCLGMTDTPAFSPNNSSSNTFYYSRNTGKCLLSQGTSTWYEMNNSTLITSTVTATNALKMQRPNLPPLVMISQDNANSLCQRRGSLTINSTSTASSTSAAFTLPTRKAQLAYSAWNTGSGFSDFENDTKETGLSLNASAKCNSSNASGLTSGYTNVDIPNSVNQYSYPGTSNSNIRSLITGSSFTNQCVSRYGIQDAIGNVREWSVDRIYCPDGYMCHGVHATTGSFPMKMGFQCPFSISSELTDLDDNTCEDLHTNSEEHGCIGSGSPVGVVTPGLRSSTPAANLVYYDSTNNNCWVSTGNTSANWTMISTSTLSATCPISSATVEPTCADIGSGAGTKCIDTTAPTSSPSRVNSFFYNRTNGNCYQSVAAPGGYTWNLYTNSSITPTSTISAINNNTQMKVNDTYFYNYALDGVKGPCVDGDANGACDDSFITSWNLADESYNAGHFSLPMGLPIHSDFKTNFPNSKIHNMSTTIDNVIYYINSLLEIGPSSGITLNALHNDGFSVNSNTIVNENPHNRCGGMTTGGSYLSGNRAGRYSAEFNPCYDTNTGSTSSQTNADIGKDVGFRCLIEIPWTLGPTTIYRE